MLPEEIHAAWELQANHVADKLGLSDEEAEKLVGAYKKTRQELVDAWLEGREKAKKEFSALGLKVGEPGKLPEDLSEEEQEELQRVLSGFMYEMMQAAAERRAVAREEFGKAVGRFLPEDRAKSAVDLLGSFSRRWDMMVYKIAGFKLGDKEAAALEAINTYVNEYEKVREEAFGETEADFLVLCEKLIGIKTARDRAFSELLSDEQFEEWQEMVLRMSRRPGAMVGGE